jgi:hypothetical protein
MSVCILARNGSDKAEKLLESLKRFRDLSFEVCIGDQASTKEHGAHHRKIADVYFEIEDRYLWDNGFGPAKQKIIDSASNDWVIIADIGEIWHENISDGGIVDSINRFKIPVHNIRRGKANDVLKVLNFEKPWSIMTDINARVLNRKEMKLLGLIHESPVLKGLCLHWSNYCGSAAPVAFVEHEGANAEDANFRKRKEILYDHLITKIVKQPSLREGTDPHWWTLYYDKVVNPRFEDITFDEWSKLPG